MEFLKELGVYAGVAVVAFAFGVYFSSIRYDAEKKTYELQRAQEVAAVVTKNAETERILQDKVNDAVDRALTTEKDLNRQFDFRRGALYDRLRADSARSENNMSDSAKAPVAIQTSECKCHVVNRREFQRLYEKQLIVARDCDITAMHYNELINLWNEMFSDKSPE